MDTKDITEKAADAAKVVVGLAAMAVDALTGAEQPAEGNPENKDDTERQETTGAQSSDQKPQAEGAGGGEPASAAGTGSAPASAEVASPASQGSTGDININKAKFDELVSLKHIGRGRAKRIMANRPFRSVEDLTARGILPEDVMAEVRSRLAV